MKAQHLLTVEALEAQQETTVAALEKAQRKVKNFRRAMHDHTQGTQRDQVQHFLDAIFGSPEQDSETDSEGMNNLSKNYNN